LVIDFANTSASGFAAAQNQILGNLNVDNVQQLSAAAPPPRPPQQTKQKPLIIIDPGHGGVDPGAIGANGVFEKHVALALSKELKKQLEASGKYRVKMTRNDDTFIKLSNRVKYARKHQGDLFISIHADSLRDSNVSGASVYTLSEKASDAQTAKLAARENKADLIAGIELEVEDEAVMDILIDIARRDTQNQSKFFANTLVKDFNSNSIKTLKRPHRYANFAVLKAPEIPSVLVEAGFMSNKKEANKLNTSTHRKKIASALKQGIDTYFKTIKDNERS
jgi:N-acetylmuramoyl-L-alanine amidase